MSGRGEARPDRSVLGAHRIGLDEAETYDEGTARILQMLARALLTRSVVAYVGSGLSASHGYPGWADMFESLWNATHTRLGDNGISARSKVLWRSFRAMDRKLRLNSTEAGLVLLGSLDQDLLNAGISDMSTTAMVRKMWAERKADREKKQETGRTPAPTCDPLTILIEEMGITRFFTPNYDDLIEATWQKVNQPDTGVGPGAVPSRANLRAMKVSDPVQDQAIAFACRANLGPAVYYGHGSSADPEDMLVLSDAHYQVRYASNRRQEVAYREGFSLLHKAGGLLFIGIGMAERDLMRPMRELLASNRNAYQAPLFAILNSHDDDDKDYVERIFFRQAYGVHLLHYKLGRSSDPAEKYSKPLCDLLRDIVRARREWWSAWRLVPAARRARYHKVDASLMMKLRRARPTRDAPHMPFPKHPVTLVHLRSPSFGSSDIAHSLVDGARATSQRVFAADLNLVSDLLTVIEAAGDFLSGEARPKDTTSPLDHLFGALREKEVTLILAGVDRLLQPENMRTSSEDAIGELAGHDDPDPSLSWVRRGVPSGIVEHRFFKHLATEAGGLRGRVILISSMVPSGKGMPRVAASTDTPFEDEPGNAPHMYVEQAPIPDTNAWLATLEPSAAPSEAPILRDVHRLLRGDRTALRQLAWWMQQHPGGRREQLVELQTRMSANQVRRRAQQVFRFVSDTLDNDTRRVLQAVAHFTSPVTPRVLTTLLDQPLKALPLPRVEAALETLEQAGFCYQTTCEVGRTTYAPVHGARQWLGETLRGHRGDAWSGLPQRFSLPGFTKDPDYERLIAPQSLKELFRKVERLTAAARSTWEAHGAENEDARAHFRAALDLVRTHLGLSALRRCEELIPQTTGAKEIEPLYPRYHRLLLALGNLLQDSHQEHGYKHHKADATLGEGDCWDHAWLYAGEVIWLSNELALIPYTEGQIQDTAPHFRKSFRAQRLVDGNRKSWRWAREQMFEGAVLIDRALPMEALRALKEARSVARARSVGAKDLERRCDGYLGLCLHLMGDYERAERRYDDAIDGLQHSRNFRALSLAYRLRGELRRHLGQLDRAAGDLDAAVRAASRGRHPDLRMAAQTSQVVLWASEQRHRPHSMEHLSKELARHHQHLNVVERYAASVGSKRLEVQCNIARIVLQLMGGDLEHAWTISRHNLAETRSYGMKLDFIRMLALGGYVSYQRGNTRSELLRTGRLRAEKAGLVHIVHRIRRLEAPRS